MDPDHDWFLSAALVITAWSSTGARGSFEKIDGDRLGSIIATVPIKWSLFSFSSGVTKAVFLLLVAWGSACLVIGVASALTGHVLPIASAAWPLVLAFCYCRRPYTLALGSKGFAWHGNTYAWQEVGVRLDRVNPAIHIRFIPNEQNRLYAAVNYLSLAEVGPRQLEVIESVVQERALWPRPLVEKLPAAPRGWPGVEREMNRVVRGAVLGACVAAVCVVAPAVGVSATLIGGTIAVAVVARRGETKSTDLPIRLWFACTLGFFVGTLLFAPFAELPAVWVALCLCSPLLGTMACAIDGAVQSME